MQPSRALAQLLGSALLSLVLLMPVGAAPIDRTAGTITLPLTRIHAVRADVPAGIQLQQHINRAHRRLARMRRRAGPSDEQLAANIQRRMYTADGAALDRRYYREGSKLVAVPVTNEAHVSGNSQQGAHGQGQAGGAASKGAKQKGAAGAAGAAVGGAAAAGAAAGGNSSASAGFSPVAEAAQEAGGLTAANTPTAGDSLGLDIQANDVGYIATVQIGTPPRDFKILMDSGSADFWVGSDASCVDTDTGGSCGNHVFLGATSSSTFTDTQTPFNVTYGTGAVAGTIVTDDVSIAGLALSAHSFGTANQESDDFAGDANPFDGLMGLALSTLSNQGVPTPPQSLATAGLINEGIVAFKISRLQDEKNDGEITFGGTDATKFDPATLVTLPNVSPDGFWEAAMDSISVDGTALALQGRTAILDTGTTLIVAPPADAAAVHAAIPGARSDGQGGFVLPCTTTASVALTFGGQAFAIDARDLVFAPVDPTDLQGECQSGISAGEIGAATEWLVGDVFLKNAYFITNLSQGGQAGQIQLAKLV